MNIKKHLKLFNTYSRKKEEVIPLNKNHINMYTCGPTIYDFAHIGNFRTYVFEDLLRKTLKFLGYNVIQVMNITDLDDKTLNGAIKKNISLYEFTEPFRQAFFEDLDALFIEKAEFYPKATQYIEKMIEIIQDLKNKKFAYKGADGSIYFSIDKFKDYGKLSHLNLKDLKKGASNRITQDEYDKENASDFVLWKIFDPKRDGNIFWDSPFGKGRPGWHIECSAMSLSLLKNTLDIHCGGIDNIFPHHENEIAQSEAYTNEKFVNIWAHSEHLIVDNKKMSKSLGNFFTLRDLIKMGYSGREVRYMLMHTHYKTQLNFTLEGLKASRSSLQRIDDFIDRLNSIKENNDFSLIDTILKEEREKFNNALIDDLNISIALSSLFDLIKKVNTLIDQDKISKNEAHKTIKYLKEIDMILSVIFTKEIEEVPDSIIEAMEKREDARKNKNFALSDELRDYILEQGYIIEDTKEGPKAKKK
ncbi:MAG: Cysteine--tRNA ligase [Candidatus Anoxychlamydiales bacterium]|nr:Cysteine--tRNA ligase [Candidatus Anoxychlamydiales bacterium]